MKYILIAYFLGNIFAKNCCSRTVYVKMVASQRWDVFFETQCIFNCLHLAILFVFFSVCLCFVNFFILVVNTMLLIA